MALRLACAAWQAGWDDGSRGKQLEGLRSPAKCPAGQTAKPSLRH